MISSNALICMRQRKSPRHYLHQINSNLMISLLLMTRLSIVKCLALFNTSPSHDLMLVLLLISWLNSCINRPLIISLLSNAYFNISKAHLIMVFTYLLTLHLLFMQLSMPIRLVMLILITLQLYVLCFLTPIQSAKAH